MKSIGKLILSFLATSVAATTIASADDQQLQNRLALQRAQNSPRVLHTTVAVYTGQQGNRQSAKLSQDERSTTRFELRSNAHGQQFGVYTAGR